MISLTIPRLGWSMDEGVFSEWLKVSGDQVQAGDMVYLLEGEKAVQEIESFDSGTLCIPRDAPKPGDKVKVGQVIGYLLADGELEPTSVYPPAWAESQTQAVSATQAVESSKESFITASAPPFSPPRVAGPAARRLARQLGVDIQSLSTPDPTGRILSEDVRRVASASDPSSSLHVPPASSGSGMTAQDARRKSVQPIKAFASPRARRAAMECGVRWDQVKGTGRDGRVRERDIIDFVSRPLSILHDQTVGPVPAIAPVAPIAPGHQEPVSKIRQTIAQRMLAGVQHTAPVTLTTKVNAQALVAWRTKLKQNTSSDIIPSYNDLIVKLVAQTIQELPQLNACWYRDGVYRFSAINIAIAVDTEFGLIAPVINNVPELSLHEIAQQSRKLIDRARCGKLSQAELQGATFTVTNLGMFDIDLFTPIINLPQGAILGMGRIVREPVVCDDRVVVGDTLSLSLTIDHRVIDGAPAARWLQRLSQSIQQPVTFTTGP